MNQREEILRNKILNRNRNVISQSLASIHDKTSKGTRNTWKRAHTIKDVYAKIKTTVQGKEKYVCYYF